MFQSMLASKGLRIFFTLTIATASFVSGSPAKSGDFVITTGSDYRDGSSRLSVVSSTGTLRFTSVLPGISANSTGRPGLTAISLDAKYAFTTLVQSDTLTGDSIYVTSLITGEAQSKQVFLDGNKLCSFTSSAPIAAGPMLSNGDYSLYVGRECTVQCLRDPRGIYYRRRVVNLRYRPSTNKMSISKTDVYSTNNDGCSSQFMSIGSLRLIDNQLYGLLFDSSKTITLLNFATSTVRASLGGFDYCNSWSFTIASSDSFYGTCVLTNDITGADTTVPTLINVTGTKVVRGPPPPNGTGDGINRYQRIYDSITTEPDSKSLYTFLDGGQNGNATIYQLQKTQFGMPPKPVLQLNPDILTANGQALRVGQLLIVP